MHEDGGPVPSGTVETRQPFRRRILAVIAALLVAVAIPLIWWVWPRPPVQVPEPADILPAGVVVSVDRSVGRCPQAKFIFTGRVTAPKPGVAVKVEWIKPEGLRTEAEEVVLGPGVQTVERRLEYTYSGNRTASGDVVLHVLAPVDLRSQPVHIDYQCP